jgi:hypothetical protein
MTNGEISSFLHSVKRLMLKAHYKIIFLQLLFSFLNVGHSSWLLIKTTMTKHILCSHREGDGKVSNIVMLYFSILLHWLMIWLAWSVLKVQILVMLEDCQCVTLSLFHKCHFYNINQTYMLIIIIITVLLLFFKCLDCPMKFIG